MQVFDILVKFINVLIYLTCQKGWNTGETEYFKRLERIIVVGLKVVSLGVKVRCKP